MTRREFARQAATAATTAVLGSLVSAAKPAIKIECVAGCGGAPDGTAKGARLIEPFGVAFDRQGNWYICEYKGQRITKVDAKGSSTLFAGREGNSTEPEGAMANQLKFNDPHGLVISKDQQMYIADTLNHRVVKLDLKTGRAATITGTGQAGYSGDGGPAVKASFNQLYAVEINRAGDKLYLTDLRNRRIRLLDLKSGSLTTIAGNGQEGVPADGAVAAESPLLDPRAAAVDSKGNVYILERRGNALRILDTNGKIRTVIGPDKPPQSKTGRERDLNGPKYLCVDLRDNVIIADAENHLIRKFEPRAGTTIVIAGTGEKGDRLVADDPLKTQLNRPHSVFVHPAGALYISDSYNHRVLKLSNW
jgi:sugar lactone lactonase YvrE